VNIGEFGAGLPVVVIPGVQGRWEWMRPGIDALAATCRVVTFSLCDEPSSGARFDERQGFNCYVDQVRDAMDQAGLDRAVICGVSFGGAIAAAFAATYPARVDALVLASALSPEWTPHPRLHVYLRAPRLLAPVFLVQSALRMRPELMAAVPVLGDRVRFAVDSFRRLVAYRPVASRMRQRILLFLRTPRFDLSHLRVPALVITGEADLDRAVPVEETRKYARLLPQARVVTLPRTGHLGVVTRPREFAALIASFVGDPAAHMGPLPLPREEASRAHG
jgi:pimeloyl-ACP methyl ester carboxylesterase